MDGKDGRIRTVDGADTFFPFKSGLESATLLGNNSTTGTWHLSVNTTANTGNYTQLLIVFFGLRDTSSTPSAWTPNISGVTDSNVLYDLNNSYARWARTSAYVANCEKNASVTASLNVTVGTSTPGILYANVYGIE